jgi:hypothetical protein
VEADDEELTEIGVAHESGSLAWGTWVCDCAVCRDICRRSPNVLLVIKGSIERRVVTAGMVADAGAEELIEQGYVREVYVAQEQPRRRRTGRRPGLPR